MGERERCVYVEATDTHAVKKKKVLDLCMQLGIEAVTVYAFSLENFNRSQDEVDYLMQLFCDAFDGFCEKK